MLRGKLLPWNLSLTADKFTVIGLFNVFIPVVRPLAFYFESGPFAIEIFLRIGDFRRGI